MEKERQIETKCVQEGYEPENSAPRVLPLYQSTTYKYNTCEQLADVFDLKENGFMYSRLGNPTCSALEKKVASLEGCTSALSFSSGLAAISMSVMNVCKAGDNIVSLSEIYGGTYNLFNVTLKKYGIETRFISAKSSKKDIEKLIDGNTKMIFAETIANPSMAVVNFDMLSEIASEHKILFAVDNTLATPILVRPKKFGANIVIHSSSKYLDGHASSIGGIVAECGNFVYSKERYPEFNEPDESYHGIVYCRDFKDCAFTVKLRAQMLRDFGCCMSPFNAYLTNMGIETLHLRMLRHSENALKVAEFLKKHEKIEWVKYPGLKDDAEHKIASKYFKNGFSGMVVFGIKGGRKAALEFMNNLKLMAVVTHIADVRSCCLHPATTTHRQLSDSDLKACGVSDNLIRLSVGIENVEDIIKDIAAALDKA